MNQTTTVGIDLDKYDAEEIIESPALHGAAFYLASDVEELLARRAEPSVTAPVAQVLAGKYANRLEWLSDEAMASTPVGTQLCAALASPAVSQQAAWGPVETVADMVRNLLMLDQSTPIHAAFHVDIAGERRCRTRPVSISRERVIDGKWVDSRRKDVPYAIIVWAEQDEPAEDK